MRRAALVLWLSGAIFFFVNLHLPDPDPSDHGPLRWIGALLALGAVVVAVRPTATVLRYSPLAAIILISATLAVGRPIGPTPFFYLWPILFSAYFLPRRDVIAAVALFVVASAAALALFVPPGTRLMLFLGSSLTFGLGGLIVATLKHRTDRLMEELRLTAATDALTGLANRRAFELALGRELALRRRTGSDLTVAFFDLDFFKQINDRHGHAAGDRALRAFAELLQREGRSGDIIARIGGEEFAAVLPGCGAPSARCQADRVLQALRTGDVGFDAPLSVSVGLAAAGPGLDSVDRLLGAADRALYAAKAGGRRRIAVHDEAGLTALAGAGVASEPLS